MTKTLISTVCILSQLCFAGCSNAAEKSDSSSESQKINADLVRLKNNLGKTSPEEWQQRYVNLGEKINEAQKETNPPDVYQANKNVNNFLQQGIDLNKPKPDGVHVNQLPFSPGHYVEQEYKNGKPNGYWKRFDKSGLLIAEGQNKDGQEVGITTGYYPSGAVKMRQFIENGERLTQYQKLDNVKEFYFENGSLRKAEIVRDGGRLTITKEYYKSGKLELERAVELKGISADGATVKETAYDETGKPFSGEKNLYGDDGNLIRQAQYADGLLEGEVKSFDKDGQVFLKQSYRKGTRVS